MCTRLIVNVSQIYLPMYLTESLSLPKVLSLIQEDNATHELNTGAIEFMFEDLKDIPQQ